MIIECLPNGMFGSNSYIVGQNGEGVVMDAGVDCEEICSTAEKLELKIKYIILTHGHIDHICTADRLRNDTGARLYVHEEDEQGLEDPRFNVSVFLGEGQSFMPADGILADGDVLQAGGLNFEVIHTPGHTPGGICIKVENSLFTGDTLFCRGIGRTDLGFGNQRQLIESISSKLLVLEDETVVYPGHGEPTTIGDEKRGNPYI